MHHSHNHIHKLSKKDKKKLKDSIVLVSSIIYPLTTLPQIIEIFRNESAANISLLTYSMYLLFTVVFLYYGISEKLKPIIILQTLWLLMYGSVLAGILIYQN